MTRPVAIRQADIERAVRGAIRGAALQPGTFEIRISLDGTVRILPFTGLADEPEPEADPWEIARARHLVQRDRR